MIHRSRTYLYIGLTSCVPIEYHIFTQIASWDIAQRFIFIVVQIAECLIFVSGTRTFWAKLS